MKSYRVTLMIPQEQIMRGHSPQDVHNQVTAMLTASLIAGAVAPSLHSIIEVEDPEPSPLPSD